MIGVNDGGLIPNPGSTGRSPVTTSSDTDTGDRATGVPEGKISLSYIHMIDKLWKEMHP